MEDKSHSRYFEVATPQGSQNPRTTRQEGEMAGQRGQMARQGWEEFITKGAKEVEAIREAMERRIEDGEKDEVNHWLERTGWLKFLSGFDRRDLVESIQEPDKEEVSERVEHAIWMAVGRLTRMAQHTIGQKAGIFVRMEAIRNEKEQKRYVPLMAYQDEEAMGLNARPWQQVLMFFARTRKVHQWKSPKYRFTKEQKKCWQEVVEEAGIEVHQQQEGNNGGERQGRDWRSSQRWQGSRRGQNHGRDDDRIDEVVEAREEAAVEAQEGELTALQAAVMDFCISLLDQKASSSEYECALVKAIAVLGVDMDGWKGVDRYPPILSKLIKVARFMVVQKAYHIVKPVDEKEIMEDGSSFDGEGEEEEIEEEEEEEEESNGSVSSSGSMPRGPGRANRRANRSRPSSQNIPSSANSTVWQEENLSEQWWGGREKLTREQHHGKEVGVVEMVGQMVDKFMVRGTNSPMQWMLDLRTYGLKMHYNTTSAGKVDWKGEDELIYKALHFNMDAFRGWVHMTLEEAKRQMEVELLRGFQAPEVVWNELFDDASNGSNGWNFLKDERNRFEVDGQRWLMDRIGRDGKALHDFVDPVTGKIRRVEVERYMKSVVRFRELMLMLMHITGGQPARGPEILSVRHSNTSKGQHRNLFIEDGMVCFVTVYHKNVVSTDKSKIIHRYLPREVGELVVLYLWLVLPFHVMLESQKDGYGRRKRQQGHQVGNRGHEEEEEEEEDKRKISHHLWPADADGKVWTSARMSRVLRKQSTQGLGQKVGIQAYREIAIAISRKFLRGTNKGVDLDDDDEDGDWNEDNFDDKLARIADRQAGHGSHVAGMIYARLMQEMTGSVTEVRKGYRASSRMWHAFLRFPSATDGTGEGTEYGTGDKRSRSDTDKVIIQWQDGQERAQVARWKLARQIDLDMELRRAFGEEAEFRGQQREALQAIMRGDARVVAIMATGEGKSMLFMLPAVCVRGGMTIVVLPLISLRQDMIRRCRKLGLSCVEWCGRRVVDDVAIVMVTPEGAGSDGFETFLNRVSGKIDRIVIDECHVVLNEDSTFRTRMQQLGKLTRAGVQMVLLTATLPVCKRGEMWKRMHWNRDGDGIQLFHGSTTRKNIRYIVRELDKGIKKEEAEEVILRMIRRKHKQHLPGKVIVYCNTVREVQMYSDKLGVDGYFSRAEMKKEKLDDFIAGRQQLIVATSALGMGVDIGDIRAVIHVGRPRKLEEYLQESGRAGRDRRRSEAIVILQERKGQRGSQEGSKRGKYGFVQRSDNELVGEYLQDKTWLEGEEGRVRKCRRMMIDEYMDGVLARGECEGDEERCNVCREEEEGEEEEGGEEEGEGEGREEEEGEGEEEEEEGEGEIVRVASSMRSSRDVQVVEEDRIEWRRQQMDRQIGSSSQVEQSREDGMKWADLERYLREWDGRCGFCHVRWGGRVDDRHRFVDCKREESLEGREAFFLVRKRVEYEGYCACFQCGAPQGMCRRWIEARDGGWKTREDKGERSEV
ncbi:hypothetical protein KVT40_002044 [Elsinoe batatas]|uniref:DNA 3'-5' helicase n=1 Tax=Elsinoe batatas TaxID=2601811 RepID=A0A8K0L7V9_9PEZI|nr:hypothetical protein KVT40_002044 [Elsinoe batatas]